jgi:ribosomal protein S18 acetylase RimI-like enzyme
MLIVRRAERTDLPSITAIQAACPEAANWNPEDYFLYDFLAAEIQGAKVAGFLCARQTAPGEREILNVCVAPVHRRLGVGRGLLDSYLNGFRGQVFLEVRMSNSGAIGFYKWYGFQELTVRKAYYHNPGEDGVVMTLHSC